MEEPQKNNRIRTVASRSLNLEQIAGEILVNHKNDSGLESFPTVEILSPRENGRYKFACKKCKINLKWNPYQKHINDHGCEVFSDTER